MNTGGTRVQGRKKNRETLGLSRAGGQKSASNDLDR